MDLSYFSINISILLRLRNKFSRLILIALDSASWELQQWSLRKCGPVNSPKVDTRFQKSNSEPYVCEAETLRHDHGHYTRIGFC